MTQPQGIPSDVDTGSLIVSYLWQRGGMAVRHELRFALQRADVEEALARLVATGYVDLAHGELPAVQLTPEAVAALTRHTQVGAPLPERLERESERQARLQAAAAGAQVELVELIREVRDENRQLREGQRLMLDHMRQAGMLPGRLPPPQLPGGQ